jgi:predicted transcriptional regulator
MATADHMTPRKQLILALEGLPDDSTFDELLRELACLRAVRRGLEDVDKGRTISNEETLQRIKSWRN